jgi:flagellar motor switch protein FliM
MEHLLGASPETVEQPADRLLSVIELELAVTVFEKIARCASLGRQRAGGFEPMLEAAACAETPSESRRRQTRRIRGCHHHVDHAFRHHLRIPR